MMSTATAAIRAKERRGSGPKKNQARKASAATTITAGTNQPATWSTSRWIGPRLRLGNHLYDAREHGVAPHLLGARQPIAPPPFEGEA